MVPMRVARRGRAGDCEMGILGVVVCALKKLWICSIKMVMRRIEESVFEFRVESLSTICGLAGLIIHSAKTYDCQNDESYVADGWVVSAAS